MKPLFVVAIVAASAFAAETSVKLGDLPPAVQAAVRQQTAEAKLVGLSVEKEKGKTMYEVETKVNGKSRDLLLDPNGAVAEVEEETDLGSIPAPAREAIQKGAGAGKIKKVEKVSAGKTVSYEAAIRTAANKNIEVGVNADGSRHKED